MLGYFASVLLIGVIEMVIATPFIIASAIYNKRILNIPDEVTFVIGLAGSACFIIGAIGSLICMLF